MTLWALRDVAFDVPQGEVIGIIGRNGSGKSTLLKILSRVTAPTTGSAELNGRVGSLLEVGTGFHPDLSGRENIYLNGALLGMRRNEINRKLEEIIAFAEIERFMDTPVKRYSSGMYVRLAFAVAAHLEPEILLIDEVLAVGDAGFQRKCLGKIGRVAREGRTVLFVSHNMAAVHALCQRVILLESGRVVLDADPETAIAAYLNRQAGLARTSLANRTDRQGTGQIRFHNIWIENSAGRPVQTVMSGECIRIKAAYEAVGTSRLGALTGSFALYGPMGEVVTDLASGPAGFQWERPPQRGVIGCEIPRLPLKAGRYTLNVCGRLNDIIADWVLDACELTVQEGDFFGTGKLPGAQHGFFLIDQSWDLTDEKMGGAID